MPSLADSELDLASTDSWGGLRPGIRHGEAKAAVEAAGAEWSEVKKSPGVVLATGSAWELELHFELGGEERLRQIACDDSRAFWRGAQVIDVPLDEALTALGWPLSQIAWRPEGGYSEPLADFAPLPSEPPKSETLARDGSAWLRGQALGLILSQGSVDQIVWRRTEDVPKAFLGPFSREQLSPPQVSNPGAGAAKSARPGSRPPLSPARRIAQIVLTIVCLVGLGITGWRGWQEYRAWATASKIKGTLTEILHPKGPRHPLYQIAYVAPSGHSGVALLPDADFYIAPEKIGEEVDLRCVPEDPPRVHGASRGDDPAMTASLLFMPWALGIAFFWFIVKMRLEAATWRQFFVALLFAIFTSPARKRRPGEFP